MKLSLPLHHETTSVKVTIYSPVVKFSRNLSNFLFYLNSSAAFPLANTSPLFETLSTLVFITSVSLLTHLAIFFSPFLLSSSISVYQGSVFTSHCCLMSFTPLSDADLYLQTKSFSQTSIFSYPQMPLTLNQLIPVECLAQGLTQSKHSIMLTTVFITVST